MKRILGIDFGTKHLGFALGDAATGIAVPLFSLSVQSEAEALRAIQDLVHKEGFDHVVIGAPEHPDGRLTPLGERVEVFARQLCERVQIPVDVVDESFTTRVASVLAEEVGRPSHDDALAAMLITQAFLNDL